MFKLSPTSRISIGLVGILSSLLLIASFTGLIPNHRRSVIAARSQLSEAIAVSFSLLAQRTDEKAMRSMLETIAARNPELLSLGIRRIEGDLLIEIGEHAAKWVPVVGEASTDSQMFVTVYSQEKPWGQVELRFKPIVSFGMLDQWLSSEVTYSVLLSISCYLAFYAYLRRVLRQLNPSRVIPNRVRAALDSLAEGLLVLDQNERIMLANRAFERATGTETNSLIGKSIRSLPLICKDETPDANSPWTQTLATGDMINGRLFGLQGAGKEAVTFSVSAAPITDENGCRRGALASFEDVSRLEQKKAELHMMVDYLRASSEEIKRQNRDLEFLATRDPLTGCLNRRAFFERFDREWESSARYQYPISTLMVDIDHFKSINDNHGHSMGDEVLRQVAAALSSAIRDVDIASRYGGEEFVVLLPHTESDAGEVIAERIRAAIGNLKFNELTVTASVGLASRSADTPTPPSLLDQADKCLYVAKRNGRNQVVRWDRVPADLVVDESKLSRTKSVPAPVTDEASIPFHAVTALISALGYRDPHTAAHSRRVADLCVTVGEGLMSLSDCYKLEIAALLHDIGKIGVPDSILLKPGPLTPDEWKTMRLNDKIGVELVRASFNCSEVTTIIEHYQTHFKDLNQESRLQGSAIPLGARILAITDAYDSMVTERTYRQGRSHHEALAELRRCAGQQFDRELVERFADLSNSLQREEHKTVYVSTKELALAIGQQLEQFCQSLDKQDFPALNAITQRLSSSAKKFGATEIANRAATLNKTLSSDRDILSVLQQANELLDICRETQRSFIQATPATEFLEKV